MAIADLFSKYIMGRTDTAKKSLTITPNDSVDLPERARSIWVGGAGSVSIVDPYGNTAVYVGVDGGQVILAEVDRVNATGTSATSLIAMI